MNYTDLLTVLQLDSLYRLLSWGDRIAIRLCMLGKSEEIPHKATVILRWITTHRWEAPQMRYGQDRLQYYYSDAEEKYKPIEDYATEHNAVTEKINVLNNNQNQ